MRRFGLTWVIAFVGLGGALSERNCQAAKAEPEQAQAEFFEREIRPLLAERCVKCHGAEKPKGGLQLISRESLVRGGETGPVVTPGKPAESRLIKAVNYQEIEMPPDGRLKQDEIARLTRWVEQGAYWPATEGKPVGDGKPAAGARPPLSPAEPVFVITPAQCAFWSLQAPRQSVPETQDAVWPRSDLDRFILNKLESRGLKPARPADKQTLIHRATLDLIGLPPTPQEVENFLADGSPRAFSRVIERLLASPKYGEHWGQHWLDVVRYEESSDPDPAHRYRDWVTRAMNRDMPYDRFIIAQIAGDLAPAAGQGSYDPASTIATGMLAISAWDKKGAEEKLLAEIVDHQIEGIGQAFLGLTIQCARCHDHRFDPISTEDYFGLAGIFFSTRVVSSIGEKGGPAPLLRIPLAGPEELTRRDERKRRVDELTAQVAQASTDAARAAATSALEKLRASDPPPLEFAYGAQEGGVPQTAHAGFQDVAVRVQGDFDRLGKIVPRRFPIVLAGDQQQPITAGSGRLQLAQWIANPDNPLTARVMVNRIWGHHFGRGIVGTPDNFGQLGLQPTHPELLDWLAVELIRSGWSIKGMHRAMMHTATYQQSAVPAATTKSADPENLLFGHMP